jgi:replicative DNA helicase
MAMIRHEDPKIEKFSELKLKAFATQKQNLIKENFKLQSERNQVHNIPHFIDVFISGMPEYNPIERDYIFDELNKLEFSRRAYKKLREASEKLADTTSTATEVLAELSELKPSNAADVHNFWYELNKAEETKTEFIKFNNPMLENMFKPRNMCTIFGDTGTCKTAFTIWMSIQFLIANPGKRVMYFEKEMPKEDIVDRLVCYHLNISNTNLYLNKVHYYNELKQLRNTTFMDDEESQKRSDQINDIMERFIIVGPEDFKDSDDVVRLIRYHEPDMWVLDFITQLAQGEHKSGSDFNFSIMNTCNQLKSVTQYGHPTFGIIISQIKKGTVEARRNKIPFLDDMEWSGTLKQVCSECLALFKPGNYLKSAPEGAFYVIPRKRRYGDLSRIMQFDAEPSKQKFNEPKNENLELWLNEYLDKAN